MTTHFFCDRCGQGFETRRQINTHLPIHRNEVFACRECEKAFVSCVNSKDVSTAKKRSESFAECNGNRPTGCTANCAPTYDMLIESEVPLETKFTTFGAVAGDRDPKPSTSLCEAD